VFVILEQINDCPTGTYVKTCECCEWMAVPDVLPKSNLLIFLLVKDAGVEISPVDNLTF
jgi:hypothetical protein